MFDRLDTLTAASVGAEVPDHRFGSIPFLRFTPAAQEIFTEWRIELELRLRRAEESPILDAHLGKYRSLVPSLALLIHLADAGTGAVDEEPLRKALAWVEYLESHARRIYAPALSPATPAARVLAKRIDAGDLETEFTAREVQRKGWSGLDNREVVAEALEVLVDFDWLRSEPQRQGQNNGGRPTMLYRVNPRTQNR